jgi:hypothetical protein
MFLQNKVSNAVSIWGMTGADGASILYSPIVAIAAAGWKLSAAADFNRDGFSDLVFQHETTNQVSIWYMGGINGLVLQTAPIVLAAAANWKVVTAGDLNRDGAPDIVLQNQVTNALSVWYLGGPEGRTLLSAPIVGQPLSGWHVIASGDFDQNGSIDLVLQHDAHNAVSIWYLSGPGGTTLTKAPIVYYAVSAWKVVGAGDMNQDGTPDLVLQNQNTNAVSTWYLGGTDGSTLISSPIIMNAAANWGIKCAQ